ncbi:hypothetical protein C8Q78DRAFT_1054502 [Trametes maxima]|nr:hypothetical protein C8Q78DRAFT_1054502 [Trametes maxima]
MAPLALVPSQHTGQSVGGRTPPQPHQPHAMARPVQMTPSSPRQRTPQGAPTSLFHRWSNSPRLTGCVHIP